MLKDARKASRVQGSPRAEVFVLAAPTKANLVKLRPCQESEWDKRRMPDVGKGEGFPSPASAFRGAS